jgi:hypothetical protein
MQFGPSLKQPLLPKYKNMSKLKNLKAITFLFIIQLITAPFALAASIQTDNLDKQDTALMAQSGLSGNSNLAAIISVLIQTILGFLGIVFLVLTIMAGFKWMTSQGNEDDIKKAKSSLKNSIIGLLIVIAAYTITYSVFTYLPFSSNSSGSGGAIGG